MQCFSSFANTITSLLHSYGLGPALGLCVHVHGFVFQVLQVNRCLKIAQRS